MVDLTAAPRLHRFGIQLLRLAVVAVTEFRSTALSMRATGLVYVTLLALVQFFAVTISVLKAFGVHQQLEPLLGRALEPLGPKSVEITSRIVEFVSNLHVGVLGVVGVVGLFVTTMLAIHQIEHALNVVWRVRAPRPLTRKVSNYLGVVLVGPVLVAAAVGLTASAQSHWLVQRVLEIEPLGHLVVAVTQVMPLLLLCFAFTFIYKFIPNTEVRFGSALVGGIVAAILWQLAGMLFTGFVAGSHKYIIIYSGLAILVLFMLWLYIAWVIVLVGAQVAYFFQYPNIYLSQTTWQQGRVAVKERVTLSALSLITQRYLSGRPPYQLSELAAVVNIPLSSLEELVEDLLRAGVVYRTAEPLGISLGRPPEQVTIEEILRLIHSGFPHDTTPNRGRDHITTLLRRRDQAVGQALEGQTLRSLAEQSPATADTTDQPR